MPTQQATRFAATLSTFSGSSADDNTISSERASFAALKMAVTELFKALSCALREERDAAEQFVARAAGLLDADALLRELELAHPRLDVVKAATRTGLAPWQIRKVKIHLESHLGSRIITQDLASIAGLSPFHFSRAFRDSFGDSPHRYILRRRIEHSQGLMLSTKASLADIALECGLVDQAHFGKLFRRLVGETPGAWRRARVNQGLPPEQPSATHLSDHDSTWPGPNLTVAARLSHHAAEARRSLASASLQSDALISHRYPSGKVAVYGP
jgi:AraC family transcriptional regulator